MSKAEAATPAMAQGRANALKDQFIMDMHTHFLRDDTRIMTFVNMRNAVGKAGWNKQLSEREQTMRTSSSTTTRRRSSSTATPRSR